MLNSDIQSGSEIADFVPGEVVPLVNENVYNRPKADIQEFVTNRRFVKGADVQA